MKPPNPPKRSVPDRANQLLSSLGDQQRKVLLAGLIFFFFMAASTTMLLGYYIYEPEITSWSHKPTSGSNFSQGSQTASPAMINIPTQAPTCAGASLQLGTSSWRLESIQRLADGSVNVPADTPGVAYWISDLENNPIFALSPTQENLTLVSALQGGEGGTVTWENCNSATYVLSAPQPGVPGTDILLDQARIGIAIYIPESALGPGLMVHGGQLEEIFRTFETAQPGEYVIDAEVSLLEISTSKDEKTIQVTISVLNYGSVPITVTANDILINPEDVAPLSLISSEPSLPQELNPQESKTLTLIFPRPTSPTAVLKVFNIEYDLEDY